MGEGLSIRLEPRGEAPRCFAFTTSIEAIGRPSADPFSASRRKSLGHGLARSRLSGSSAPGAGVESRGFRVLVPRLSGRSPPARVSTGKTGNSFRWAPSLPAPPRMHARRSCRLPWGRWLPGSPTRAHGNRRYHPRS